MEFPLRGAPGGGPLIEVSWIGPIWGILWRGSPGWGPLDGVTSRGSLEGISWRVCTGGHLGGLLNGVTGAILWGPQEGVSCQGAYIGRLPEDVPWRGSTGGVPFSESPGGGPVTGVL